MGTKPMPKTEAEWAVWNAALAERAEQNALLLSQAEVPKPVLKVTEKKVRGSTTKPLAGRVSKPRKSKVVATAKLTTHRGNTSQGASKATAKPTAKARKENTSKSATDGPRVNKTYDDFACENEEEYEAEAIKDSKLEKGRRYYLVKWLGYPDSASTWEPNTSLQNLGGLIAEFKAKQKNQA